MSKQNQSESVEALATIIDRLILKAFIQSSPKEWMENEKTAIHLTLPVPQKSIDAFEQIKKEFDEVGLVEVLEFNDLLSMAVLSLVCAGLREKVIQTFK